jgi:two-component system, NtrC family, sensor kinase
MEFPRNSSKKFSNPSSAPKEVGKDTGLGLSICYGIIEAHGGRIEVESRRNEGTPFRVLLPVLYSSPKRLIALVEEALK